MPSTALARCNRAFTLVEVMIVIAFIAIMAAAVLPMVSTTSDKAHVSNVKSQLRTIRLALGRYRVEHGGSYPSIDQLWDNLISTTSGVGEIVEGGTYGPYMQKAPLNTITGSSGVIEPDGDVFGSGWIYDPTSDALVLAIGFDEATETITPPATE